MLLDILMILAGGIVLIKGADWLVEGGVGIALKSGISPLIVGLTVVAFGTSAPELSASIIAAIRGSGDLSYGNVIGSNVANIALILGLTALIRPVDINPSLGRRDIPFMVVISVIIWLVGIRGVADRFTGLFLVTVFAGYVYACTRVPTTKPEVNGHEASRTTRALVMFILVGIAGLVIGGQLLVAGAQSIAIKMGISDAVIGLTVVAIGTSLPELATSLVAAAKGHADISLGNIVGSNIFNILLVIGVTASIIPYNISPDRFLTHIGLPVMMGLAVIVWPFALSGRKISRIEGGILFAVYCIYSILAVMGI